MPTATMTSKGQITLPKEIRDRANAHAGTRFDVRMDDAGNIVLEPKRISALELSGKFRTPGVHFTIEQMKEAVLDQAAEEDERIRRQQRPAPTSHR